MTSTKHPLGRYWNSPGFGGDGNRKDHNERSPDVGSIGTTAPLSDERYIGLVFKDQYLIEKRLSTGGIGEVYLARDQLLHSKPVVVKVLLEDSAKDEWLKKKFRQEIEALARIEHPGVVGVLGAGYTPDGKPFLVMQYVKGQTLRSLIKYDGMDFEQVATIIRQAGLALTAAHEQGVLHCDLKPENIMLQDLGEGEYQVKIVDFGVAKIKDSQVTTRLSGTRTAGTALYMAPEQIQGRPSAETDVFALGVVAYEMLTGRRPFNPSNQYQLLETLRAGVRLKPRDLRVEVPLEAQEIVLKALSFDARDRYQRARDYGELLAQALTCDLELPARDACNENDLEMAHVLFVDVVGYSKLPTDEQTQVVKQLRQIVSGTEEFQRAKTTQQLISRSTGDGMALVFFSGPKAPVECAVEIARTVCSRPQIKLRMGIHSGPVYRVKDMNETVDVAGSGINMAQRVMDCGDAGHILLSKTVADVLGELAEWRVRIHDLGECKVKHGVRIHVCNLQFGEIGNPCVPEKIGKKRKILFAAMVVGLSVLLATAVVLRAINHRVPPDRTAASNTNTASVTSPDIERMFSYSLTVRQVSNGAPIGEPQPVAGEDRNLKDRDVKLNIKSGQSGYLYVLSERPSLGGGPPRYQVIYPRFVGSSRQKISVVEVPDEDNWIPPLANGEWTLWLVWSDDLLDEIEYAKALPKTALGMVVDAARNKAIRDLLVKNQKAETGRQRDDARKQTDVIWKGNALACQLILQYQ